MSSRSLKAAAASNNDVLTIDQLRHQDDWVLDTERYRCHVCTRNFTRFRRKHHCRKVRSCRRSLLVTGGLFVASKCAVLLMLLFAAFPIVLFL